MKIEEVDILFEKLEYLRIKFEFYLYNQTFNN